jgi:hypothetical protein
MVLNLTCRRIAGAATLAAGLTAGLVPAAAARAQPAQSAYGRVSSSQIGSGDNVLCDVAVPQPQPQTVDTTCGDASAYGRIRATAEFNALRARAVTEVGPGSSLDVFSSTATAEFYDAFTFGGGLVPTRLVFDIALTGNPSASIPATTAGVLTGNLVLQTESGDRARAYYEEGRSGFDGDFVRSQPTATLDVPLTGAYFRFVLQLQAGATLYTTARDPIVAGLIDADFYQTGRITAIRAFDSEGRDAFGRFTVTSASGAAYPFVAVAAVPEPSTYALVAAGLAGIGAVVRRRRAARAG